MNQARIVGDSVNKVEEDKPPQESEIAISAELPVEE
jgi:hypothetical protein